MIGISTHYDSVVDFVVKPARHLQTASAVARTVMCW